MLCGFVVDLGFAFRCFELVFVVCLSCLDF